MKEITVAVQHWKYYDKGNDLNIPKGYYCDVYTNDTWGFIGWMKENCPSANVTPRFNSGNPMVQTYIKRKKDVTIFSMRWL
jgi:hypothetical protein